MARRDLLHPAEKRVRNYEAEAAQQFESTILHNRVHDRVREDEELRHLLDVAERAYALADVSEFDDVDRAAFDAAEIVNDRVDDVVERAVANVLLETYDSLDEFGDVWGPDDIEAARKEAERWFADHRETVLEVADGPVPERLEGEP